MTKATVTRVFFGGMFAAISGAILLLAAMVVGSVNDVFVMNGPDIVGVRGSALTWPVIGLAIVGALAIGGGAIASLVAWIGALLNVSQLARKTWFVVLLLVGIFNSGGLGMIVYIIAGPDGSTRAAPRKVHASAGA
jgi:hypothetical protein